MLQLQLCNDTARTRRDVYLAHNQLDVLGVQVAVIDILASVVVVSGGLVGGVSGGSRLEGGGGLLTTL